MFKLIIYIGAGSCLGGVARFLLGTCIGSRMSGAFPWGTFAVNLIGCFAIGLIYGLLDRGFNLSPEMKAFLTVGFCGGFTTFSTFVHENYQLFGTYDSLVAIVYAVASFGLGLLLAHGGHYLAKII